MQGHDGHLHWRLAALSPWSDRRAATFFALTWAYEKNQMVGVSVLDMLFRISRYRMDVISPSSVIRACLSLPVGSERWRTARL